MLSRVGLSKKAETFLFFNITDVPKFRVQLKNLIPHITTAKKAMTDKAAIKDFKKTNNCLMKVKGMNIGFSRFGIQKVECIPLERKFDLELIADLFVPFS